MNRYERLLHGETFRMSDFREDRPFYLSIINDLRTEKVAGQFTMPLEGEEQQLTLNVVHPIPLTPHEEYLKRRSEALNLINGSKLI